MPVLDRLTATTVLHPESPVPIVIIAVDTTCSAGAASPRLVRQGSGQALPPDQLGAVLEEVWARSSAGSGISTGPDTDHGPATAQPSCTGLTMWLEAVPSPKGGRRAAPHGASPAECCWSVAAEPDQQRPTAERHFGRLRLRARRWRRGRGTGGAGPRRWSPGTVGDGGLRRRRARRWQSSAASLLGGLTADAHCIAHLLPRLAVGAGCRHRLRARLGSGVEEGLQSPQPGERALGGVNRACPHGQRSLRVKAFRHHAGDRAGTLAPCNGVVPLWFAGTRGVQPGLPFPLGLSRPWDATRAGSALRAVRATTG